MDKNKIGSNISFDRYKNYRNIKETYQKYSEYLNNISENLENFSEILNIDVEVKELIENNKDYYNFLTEIYSSPAKYTFNFDKVEEKSATNQSNEIVFSDFKNPILYAYFLSAAYNITENSQDEEVFINKTIELLNNQNEQFWLLDSYNSFNSFIMKVKKDEISLKDYKSFLPPNKLLWGFDEFMKKATAESLKNHLNSIKYIDLIAKHEFLDTKIDEILNNNEISNTN